MKKLLHFKNPTILRPLLAATVFLVAMSGPLAGNSGQDRFTDPEDGKIDISDYLANPGRFLPVPIIITEPAVGFGLGLAAVFLQPRHGEGEAGWKRPNISAAGGLATENGTTGGGVFDMRYWRNGTLKSKAGLFSTSVNLDFYGFNSQSDEMKAIRYNLDVKGTHLALEKTTPIENLSVEMGYTYADITASLARDGSSVSSLPDGVALRISGLSASLIYDSRDNLFSPQNGVFSKTTVFASGEVLGADVDFQKLSQMLILYHTINEHWMAGIKVDRQKVFGDYPFFAKPFISLRGVPAMMYQGESMLCAEIEVQHRLTERFRVLGFVGAGQTWDSIGPFDRNQSVTSGGVGFRYRLARKFGMDVGVDVATSGEDSAIYLQFGSAWLRM
jgi:outer membrane protein assembly factor BamA